MKNYLQLELGGKPRGLKFNLGTLNYIQELTGTDPFEFKATGSAYSDLLPMATTIVHAALLSNCLSKQEAPDFTENDVRAWMNDIEGVGTLADIINRYNNILNPPKSQANGEVSADTQTII